MIFPVARNGNSTTAGGTTQPTPDVLRCRADASERGEAIRSPPFTPKQRHATSAQPGDAPDRPRPSRTAAGMGPFSCPPPGRRLPSPLLTPPARSTSLPQENAFFAPSVKERFSSPGMYGKLRTQILPYNYHPWIIHHHAVVSFRPWVWLLAPWLPVPSPTPRK